MKTGVAAEGQFRVYVQRFEKILHRVPAPAQLAVAALVAGAAAVSIAGCASAPSASDEAWRAVRVTYDRQAVSGCQSVGIVSDEKWTRLQKDTYKFGGNTVLVVGGNTTIGWDPMWGNRTQVTRTGEAYRCPR